MKAICLYEPAFFVWPALGPDRFLRDSVMPWQTPPIKGFPGNLGNFCESLPILGPHELTNPRYGHQIARTH